MTKKIERNYLEINSLKELNSSTVSSDDYLVKLINPADFEINKFFYKNIGKKHHWVDRLTWTNEQWIKYTSDVKLKTYVLQKNNDLAGYFELISHTEINEVEIAYLGLLEEYQNKKLGSHLLSSAIKNSFLNNPGSADPVSSILLFFNSLEIIFDALL